MVANFARSGGKPPFPTWPAQFSSQYFNLAFSSSSVTNFSSTPGSNSTYVSVLEYAILLLLVAQI
ncbi:hypothetical protein CUMW_144930 [Citrus unshiu]|nr:hypothetical protein CUMW_144930 [Citrus unshiu]